MRYQFVDCRWELGDPARGRELYLAGHVPGASFLDVDEDLSDLSIEGAGRHPLPSAERFAESASRAGIGAGVLVVAYGQMGGPERLWWLLRHFGHDDCAVLQGGIDAWQGPLSQGEEQVERAHFEPQPRNDDTMSADEIASRLDDNGLVVVDARAEARWRGEANPIDKIPGRIPGAVNVPFTRGRRPAGRAPRRPRDRRLLRVRGDFVRHPPGPGAGRTARRQALPRLVERVGGL